MIDVENPWEKLRRLFSVLRYGPDRESSANISVNASSVVLEESRLLYEDEEDRRRTIERKLIVLTGINTIIFSVIIGLDLYGPFLVNVAFLFAVLSALIPLLILTHDDYDRPLGVGDVFQMAQKSNPDIVENMIKNYRDCVYTNKQLNEVKFDLFNACIMATILSISLLTAYTLVL